MRQKTTCASRSLVAMGLVMWAAGVVADPNVKILSPADGGKVKVGEPVVVSYELVPNPGGDHSHIYVNGKEAGVLRKQKGTYTLDPLPAGSHELCLKVVNKGHASINQGTCIKVTGT